MGSRFTNPKIQYSDDAGKPLPEGKLFFYDSGTTNLRDTFADSSLSIVNPNPVIIDGAGRIPNIWLEGNYNVVLTDADDNQIWQIDPVQGTSGVAQFSNWLITTIYNLNDIVSASDGSYYISITNSNLGNDPTVSPSNWSKIVFITVWNTNQTYSINDTVSFNGVLYASLVDSNVGNQPDTSPTEWKPAAGAASAVSYDNSVSGWTGVSSTQGALDEIYRKIGRKNYVINPDFDIWQRGVGPFTAATEYTADRFQASSSVSTASATQSGFAVGQTDVPNNPEFHFTTAVTSGSTAASFSLLQHKLECVRTLSGETATVSFWAKASAALNLSVEFVQIFGTGGSPSAAVDSIGVQKFSLTTSWQKFQTTVSIPSIAGKTLGTNDDDILDLIFWFDAGSDFSSRTDSLGNQSGTFDISQIQLEEGNEATEFEYIRNVAEELQICQRYYETGVQSNYWSSGQITEAPIWRTEFKTRKRVIPSITQTEGGRNNLTGSATPAGTVTDFTVSGLTFTATGQANILLDYQADSEL